MKYELSKQQVAYLQSLVSGGVYRSLEDAIDERLNPPGDDMWIKPYINESLADEAAGRVSPWNVDTLRAELRARHPEMVNGED